MNDITKITDHAAAQSDRWLFIATLLVLIAFGIFIWRWITGDRNKLSNRLTEITDRHIQSQEKLIEVVSNNTNALKEVKDVMGYCRSKTQFPH